MYLFFFQLIHLDYDVNSNIHLDSSDNPYLIIATLFMLVFDALLYLALTLYFDKILPTEYGHRRSPWFFLKSSFWFQHPRADHVALENEIDSDSSPNDSFEPVSPEFHGKEAIRIRNLKKEYGKGNNEKVEALKGNKVTSHLTRLLDLVTMPHCCTVFTGIKNRYSRHHNSPSFEHIMFPSE
uniref:Uncharacterized protein n=1 Tax=Canis lupus familiaris TaxID=9615 RepID=A0A8C0SBP1_CANLF